MESITQPQVEYLSQSLIAGHKADLINYIITLVTYQVPGYHHLKNFWFLDVPIRDIQPYKMQLK